MLLLCSLLYRLLLLCVLLALSFSIVILLYIISILCVLVLLYKSSYLTSACYYYYYVYALNSRQYYVSYRVCGFFGIHARVFYTIVVAMWFTIWSRSGVLERVVPANVEQARTLSARRTPYYVITMWYYPLLCGSYGRVEKNLCRPPVGIFIFLNLQPRPTHIVKTSHKYCHA